MSDETQPEPITHLHAVSPRSPEQQAKLNAFREFKQTIEELAADIVAYRDQMIENDTPRTRRSFVRAVFASIEGTTFTLKQMALLEANENKVQFDPGELSMLEEVDYFLDKGQVKRTKAKLRTAENLQFSILAVAKAQNRTFQLDLGGQGWQNFTKALAIRDRLTHPKRLNDIQVSDDDIRTVIQADRWYDDELTRVFAPAATEQPD